MKTTKTSFRGATTLIVALVMGAILLCFCNVSIAKAVAPNPAGKSDDGYSTRGALDITITPIAPPIVIPATGGSFPYFINVQNLASTPRTFRVWNKVRDAANNYYLVFGPTASYYLPGLGGFTHIWTQTIQGNLPTGVLMFISYVGNYSTNTILDSSFFAITKLATGDGGPWISENSVTGDLNFDETSVATPAQFALMGNYPNPFNPTTNISYSLATAGNVKLTVFDATGREVATLVNGFRDAGSHEITFDASKLASGVYLYQLNSGSQVATGKMVLMK